MTDDGLHVLLPDDCVDLEQFFFFLGVNELL